MITQARTKDIHNILHVWELLFQHRDKVSWDESLLSPLAVAIFSSKQTAKAAELMQLVLESNHVRESVDTNDVQAVVQALTAAEAVGLLWLPVAVSWLVYHGRVEAALDLFSAKAVAYPGDSAARALVALSKLSQQSDLPAAIPVLFECVEFMLSQPEMQLSVGSLNALVKTCEYLQNYPLAGEMRLTAALTFVGCNALTRRTFFVVAVSRSSTFARGRNASNQG